MSKSEENKYKKKFLEEFKSRGGWYETYEPSRGGGVGIPDAQLLVSSFHIDAWICEHPSQFLVPIEFKWGELKDDGLLYPKDIRPNQIGWHTRFNRAGGLSFFVILNKDFSCILGGAKRKVLMDAHKGLKPCDYYEDFQFNP